MGLAQKLLPLASPQRSLGGLAARSTRLRGPIQRTEGGCMEPCGFESMMAPELEGAMLEDDAPVLRNPLLF
jgi:hypothetical protein